MTAEQPVKQFFVTNIVRKCRQPASEDGKQPKAKPSPKPQASDVPTTAIIGNKLNNW